jgi:cardiolipin synthase A/B
MSSGGAPFGTVIALIVLVALIVVDLGIRIGALVLVPRNRRPQTALAWLLAIYFIPYFGLVLFLIAGRARLPRARRRKQAQVDLLIRRASEQFEDDAVLEHWPPQFRASVTLNKTLGSIPLAAGNSATLHPDDTDALASMVRAIEGARRAVHCEFYILLLDDVSRPFFEALAAAVARGVRVRVLLDHLGSVRYPGYRRTIRYLQRHGIDFHLMLPFQPWRGKLQRPDLRNHRKLLVIDGVCAFTGSRNIVEPGYQRKGNHKRGLRWSDFMVEFHGPVVAALDAIFATDWYCEADELLEVDPPVGEIEPTGVLECQVVPSGPGYERENNLRLFVSLVHSAQQKVVITSPYFVPDDAMLYAITTAAESGIQVELFVSEIGDQFLVYHAQRSYYEELLQAGVRIWLYERPVVLHAKHFTIDDEISVIGSSNMDMRSFTLDLELSVMVRGGDFLQRMRALEQDYRDHSHELTLDEWRRRGSLKAALDNVARLTSVVQ